MNAKNLIAAVTLITAAGGTFAADNAAYVDHSQFQSTKTRADVRAELHTVNANGELARAPEFVEHRYVASDKSREEVRGEALQQARGRQNIIAVGS